MPGPRFPEPIEKALEEKRAVLAKERAEREAQAKAEEAKKAEKDKGE